MFLKPFRVKTNTAIKGSDRKKLRETVSKQFPDLTSDDLKTLIPNKEEMSVAKLHAANDSTIVVYCLQKNPMFFEVSFVTYPTVYTLWKFPDLLPTFTTFGAVFDKLCSGADLMLPGVVTDKEYHPKMFGKLNKFDCCAVNLTCNRAPIAVGKTAMSSDDMFMSGKKGKGVIIVHTYLDHLWAMGDKTKPVTLPSPFPERSVTEDETDGEDVEQELDAATPDDVRELVEDLKIDECAEETTGEGPSDSNVIEDEIIADANDGALKSPLDLMDELLNDCFLHALKVSGKKLELPILTSTFYKAHILPCVPYGKVLDVKRSSHKKLSKFLKEMQEKGIVQIKELSKGVESITAVNTSHTDVRSFDVPEEDVAARRTEETSATDKYEPPTIVEMHVVTAAVLPLFRQQGLCKGAFVTLTDVRKHLKDHVKANELQSKQDRSLVNLDQVLREVALQNKEYSEHVTWESLTTRVLNKMKPAYEITFSGQKPISKKGNLEPIEISISQRAGNKKVTLVNNLEVFGISPQEFAHKVQIGVATSTSVYTAPNRKDGNEVLVQGNQTNFIARLLLEDYQLNKKYIKGLENAPKKGKKK